MGKIWIYTDSYQDTITCRQGEATAAPNCRVCPLAATPLTHRGLLCLLPCSTRKLWPQQPAAAPQGARAPGFPGAFHLNLLGNPSSSFSASCWFQSRDSAWFFSSNLATIKTHISTVVKMCSAVSAPHQPRNGFTIKKNRNDTLLHHKTSRTPTTQATCLGCYNTLRTGWLINDRNSLFKVPGLRNPRSRGPQAQCQTRATSWVPRPSSLEPHWEESKGVL